MMWSTEAVYCVVCLSNSGSFLLPVVVEVFAKRHAGYLIFYQVAVLTLVKIEMVFVGSQC